MTPANLDRVKTLLVDALNSGRVTVEDVADTALDAVISALNLNIDFCGCQDCRSYYSRGATRVSTSRERVVEAITAAISEQSQPPCSVCGHEHDWGHAWDCSQDPDRLIASLSGGQSS